eukprot:755656-Hanusia_phi.AAC.5
MLPVVLVLSLPLAQGFSWPCRPTARGDMSRYFALNADNRIQTTGGRLLNWPRFRRGVQSKAQRRFLCSTMNGSLNRAEEIWGQQWYPLGFEKFVDKARPSQVTVRTFTVGKLITLRENRFLVPQLSYGMRKLPRAGVQRSIAALTDL